MKMASASRSKDVWRVAWYECLRLAPIEPVRRGVDSSLPPPPSHWLKRNVLVALDILSVFPAILLRRTYDLIANLIWQVLEAIKSAHNIVMVGQGFETLSVWKNVIRHVVGGAICGRSHVGEIVGDEAVLGRWDRVR